MPMKLLCLICFALTTLLQAQTPTGTLTLTGPAAITPGSPVLLTLTQAGGSPAALAFTISAGPDVTAYAVTLGAAASAAGKTITCNSRAGLTACVIVGQNATAMANGVVAQISATLVAKPVAIFETFAVASPQEASSTGLTVPVNLVAVLSIPFTVYSPCDLNKDGVTNILDLEVLLSWITKTKAIPSGLTCDLNGNGVCDIYDTAIIVTAATGGACTAL